MKADYSLNPYSQIANRIALNFFLNNLAYVVCSVFLTPLSVSMEIDDLNIFGYLRIIR